MPICAKVKVKLWGGDWWVGVEGMKPHTKLAPHLGETREMITMMTTIAVPLTERANVRVCGGQLSPNVISTIAKGYHIECVVTARLIFCSKFETRKARFEIRTYDSLKN